MSAETRKSIVNRFESGKSPKEIATALEIKYEAVRSVLRTYKKSGRIEAIKRRTPKIKKITPEIENFVKSKIEADVSVTLKSLRQCIMDEKDVVVSLPTIERSLQNLNYSFKRVTFIPEARNNLKNIENRFAYANNYLLLDEEKTIFVDEMGVSCSLRLNYGRSPVGTPARKVVRSIRSRNHSICAAISKSGIILHKTLNRACNGDVFVEYLVELLKRMRELNLANFTIIMDNVAFHKVSEVGRLIEEYGHNILYLSPYSPQLNPIEEFFGKWKHYVRSANSNTVGELEIAIMAGCSSITSSDCLGFYSDVRRWALKAVRREEF